MPKDGRRRSRSQEKLRGRRRRAQRASSDDSDSVSRDRGRRSDSPSTGDLMQMLTKLCSKMDNTNEDVRGLKVDFQESVQRTAELEQKMSF